MTLFYLHALHERAFFFSFSSLALPFWLSSLTAYMAWLLSLMIVHTNTRGGRGVNLVFIQFITAQAHDGKSHKGNTIS